LRISCKRPARPPLSYVPTDRHQSKRPSENGLDALVGCMRSSGHNASDRHDHEEGSYSRSTKHGPLREQ